MDGESLNWENVLDQYLLALFTALPVTRLPCIPETPLMD